MHKPLFRKKPLLIAMATAWVTFTPATQASLGNEISTAEGQTSFSGTADTLTLTPSGSFISSSGTALSFQSVIMGTFNNNGTIQSASSSFNDAGMNIDTASTVNTFNNAGLLGGNTSGSNTYGLYNRGTIGTLENSADGTIEGFTAINNNRTITSLANQGTIRGTNTGILNFGTITNFTNNGLIEASYAILNPGVLTNGITNNGIIRGSDASVYNFGTLSVINNNGTLEGNIWNDSANVLTINGGSSYDSLITGYNGGGTVLSSAADVHFGTGKLTVDDDFRMGSHTVVNEGASLLLKRTVTIAGNYIQQAQGELAIGVADGAIASGTTLDSGYGRLVVSGDAIFAPSSSVSLLSTGHSYGFASGQRYLVVQASGTGTQYNASDLTYHVANYNGTVTGKAVTVDGKNSLVVYLDSQPPVTPTTPTTPVTPVATTPVNNFATTPNAIASLSGLSSYSGFSDGLLSLFNASKALGSSEEANKAGEQLSPVQNSAASNTAAAASSGALDVVNNHMNNTRLVRNDSVQSGISTGDDAQEWAVWGQPFYGSARQGMIDNVSGYTAHYGGVVLGADRQIADSWRVGGAFSYAHSAVNGRDNLTGSHTDVDAWSGIAYASWSGNPLYVNLTTSVSTQQYDSQRQIGFDGFAGQADGRFNGQQVMAKAEVGYPIFFGQGTTLTPLAAMGYSYLHQDDYKEHSEQGAALDVDSSHTQSVRSSLGAKLEHSWSTDIGDVVPFAQAMWTHEYDRSRTATSASYAADALGETRFTSLGATPVADTADIGAGVALVQDNDLSISARYDLSTAPHFNAQTVSLRLRKTF
jgi:outer membrane autotransporter protein